MAQEFKQGDTVEWNTPQGKTRGTVKKKLTSSTEVGGQNINGPTRLWRGLRLVAHRARSEQPHGPNLIASEHLYQE